LLGFVTLTKHAFADGQTNCDSTNGAALAYRVVKMNSRDVSLYIALNVLAFPWHKLQGQNYGKWCVIYKVT